jgi:UPF0716 family protein affecting phage T7 exclusion
VVTLAVLFVPGIIGVWLVYREGLRCWREFRHQLARGEPPAAQVLDGLLILVAAVLLVTPGVLTDLAAIVLLIPPIRHSIRRYVIKRLQARIRSALAKSPWLNPSPASQAPVSGGSTGASEGSTSVPSGGTGVSPVHDSSMGKMPVPPESGASNAPVPPGPDGPQ